MDLRTDARALHRYLTTLPEFVLPVTARREGSKRVDPCGSAVLATAGGRLFVISAAHVFEGHAEPPMIHGIRGAAAVPQAVLISDPSGRLGVDVDLAYAELTRDQTEQIELRAALDLTALPPDPLGAPGDAYVAIGYPVSKTTVDVGRRHISNSQTHLSVIAVPEAAYSELRVTPRSHLLLHYDRDATKLFGKPPSRAVHPRGMSGGVVLRPFRDGSAIRADVAGIVIEYRERPNRLLIASRFAYLLESMRQHYPDLAPLLPLSGQGSV